MKFKLKQLITIVILLIIFIIALCFILKKEPNEKKEQNNQNIIKNEEKLNIEKEQNINNIIFTNIKCEYDGHISVLKYTVVNKTDKTINLGAYEIKVKNKNNEVIANIINVIHELRLNPIIPVSNSVNTPSKTVVITNAPIKPNAVKITCFQNFLPLFRLCNHSFIEKSFLHPKYIANIK